jgi:hypothetical protein
MLWVNHLKQMSEKQGRNLKVLEVKIGEGLDEQREGKFDSLIYFFMCL